MQTERMELAVQSLMAENLYHIHDKSQNRSVAVMSGLIQNKCDKGWVWIKGVIGKGPMKGQSHYWLENDGWALESADLPGTVLTDPHAILIMDAELFRKEMKVKAVTTRKPKQVTQWLLKQKKKRTAAMQNKSLPGKPAQPLPPTSPVKTITPPEPATAVEPSCKPDSLETIARDLTAMDTTDKNAYKERLMTVMADLKKREMTQTQIATVFLKEKVPTRSGRGLWSPRMVGEVFKQI